jgi:hypothetical protein
MIASVRCERCGGDIEYALEDEPSEVTCITCAHVQAVPCAWPLVPVPAPPLAPLPVVPPPTSLTKFSDQLHGVKCLHCGELMSRTRVTDRDWGLQWLGCFLGILAVLFLFWFPLGTLLGLFLFCFAARLGYKRRRVWLCPCCGYAFDRR